VRAFRQLDQVLRGEARLADGSPVSAGPVARAAALLMASYGVCMGVYGLGWPTGVEWRQTVAGAVKLPALFALTLGVTLPSLYVFNVLFGPRLRPKQLVKLVGAALGVTAALLAAFGPITAFFSVTTVSYAFVVLLNVAICAVSASFGLGTMRRMLRDHLRPTQPAEPSDEFAGPSPNTVVFFVWMVLFGLVGMQMSWLLRPFIGSPELPFAWFRPRDGSFFEAVFGSVRQLLGVR
jgi:hypothetical protein